MTNFSKLFTCISAFALASCGGAPGTGPDVITSDITHAVTINADVDGNTFSETLTIDAGETLNLPNADNLSLLLKDTFAGVSPAVAGVFALDSVQGCGVTGVGNSFATESIIADCTITASYRFAPSAVSELSLDSSGNQAFRFSWVDQDWVSYYTLEENPDGNSEFSQLGDDIAPGVQAYDHPVELAQRVNASYVLQGCVQLETIEFCERSAAIAVDNTALRAAIGYFKASNTAEGDQFGHSTSLSADGSTLAVGAYLEDSSATGINGNEADKEAVDAGAVYVFTRVNDGWQQQAYLKASNTGAGDRFGYDLSLSADGSMLAVGAYFEDGNATGINGDQANNDAANAGAVYVYTRNNEGWQQDAYIKASNTDSADHFGYALSLSADGSALAVGAYAEDGNATGVNGVDDNSDRDAGSVYVFSRNTNGWQQDAYIKASNTDAGDKFGNALSLSADGSILAVSAFAEDGDATGINGDEAGNSAQASGAVYVFTENNDGWQQEAYIKASNADADDGFGTDISLSADGAMLAVGAYWEDSDTTGINGDANNNAAEKSGAAYVFSLNVGQWQQDAYIKAGNTDASDWFGFALSLSADGSTLVVGAGFEDSFATGINGFKSDNSKGSSGAVYVFTLSDNQWQQEAYVKARNADSGDYFGSSVSLNADGSRMVVGSREDSNATGINGNDNNNDANGSGAVYLYGSNSGTDTGNDTGNDTGGSDNGGDDGNDGGDNGGDNGGDGNVGNDITYTVTINANVDGNPFSETRTVDTGDSVSLVNASNIGSLLSSALPNLSAAVADVFALDSIQGCDGSLTASDYTTGSITADCTITANFSFAPAAVSELSLDSSNTQIFNFSWVDQAWANYYKLEENPDGASGFSQLGDDIAAGVQAYEHPVQLAQRVNASYILQSCVQLDTVEFCETSTTVTVDAEVLTGAITYFKASNTEALDLFGYTLSLSADGSTLAVATREEASNATGINGDQTNNDASKAGAVYVFTRDNGQWLQQAYIKASNTRENNFFGTSVSLNADGSMLAVGAPNEDGNSTGVNGDQTNERNDGGDGSGAVYVYARSGDVWRQEAYLKASNADPFDNFGHSLSISADGQTLAVGAYSESSVATGVGGDQANNEEQITGAVYVFARNDGDWSQDAYIKATDDTDRGDRFGWALSLSADGRTLAVNAQWEDGSIGGINGDQQSNGAEDSGAVYIYSRSDSGWQPEAYLKASNPDVRDEFGFALSLSADGSTLAVGAYQEDSNATDIIGDQDENSADQDDNSATNAGAVYVFTRDDGQWAQEAYIKASNTEAGDLFGAKLSLSADGSTLAVGATREDSSATGINGDLSDNSAVSAGAVYVFTRSENVWMQESYIKASNTEQGDSFGFALSLSADGSALAVSSPLESGNDTGVDGDQSNNDASAAGAVYLYESWRALEAN